MSGEISLTRQNFKRKKIFGFKKGVVVEIMNINNKKIYYSKHKKLVSTLEKAVLNSASLNGASLNGASLNGASLNRASLNGASLNRASLNGASLDGASLNGASLDGASLNGASLNGASLNRASLDKASLKNARYSIMAVLKINWGNISDEMTLELMRHDAEFCGEDKMNAWANGGSCPYNLLLCRDFNFYEDKSLWKPGPPKYRGIELFQKLCEEKKIII